MSGSKNNANNISSMLDLNNVSSNTLSTATSINSTTPAPPEQTSISHLTSNTPSPKLYHRSIEDSLEPQDSKRKKLNAPWATSSSSKSTSTTTTTTNTTTITSKPVDSDQEISKLNQLALSTMDTILDDLPLDHSIGYLAYEFMKLCKSKHLHQNYLMHELLLKFESNFTTNVKPKLEDALESINDPLEFGERFYQVFDNWYNKVLKLNKIFIFLDTNYLALHYSKESILRSAISLFNRHMIDGDKDRDTNSVQIQEKFMQLLQKWREDVVLKEGNPKPNVRLQEVSLMFTKLMLDCHSSKLDKFENELIESIVSSYKILSRSWLASNDKPFNYIEQVFKAMNENLRFFSATTIVEDYFIRKLFSKLRWSLIFENFNELMSKTFDFLICNPKELHLIYGYCSNAYDEFGLNAVLTFVYQWGVFTKNSFKLIVNPQLQKKSSTGHAVINDLVIKFKFFEDLANSQFKNDEIHFQLRKSLTGAIGSSPSCKSLIIFQLSKYCDNYFKQKLSIPYKEFEENFITIFKAIGEKLDFVNIYKRDLSKRILFSSKFNSKEEQKLVNTLLSYLGPTDESHSLPIMLSDIITSIERYKDVIKVPKPKEAGKSLLSDSFEFQPLILTKKEWPDIPNNEDMSNFRLHPILQSMIEEMTNYYLSSDSKFKMRQLDWTNYKLHQVTLSVRFKQGDKDITGNLLQILVILIFANENFDGYSLEHLTGLIGLNSGFLSKILNSITTEKYKILVFKDGKYHFNDSFTDKSKNIKLPMIRESSSSLSSSKSEQQQEQEVQQQLTDSIQANRDDEFKSCVVKIMKQEKQLDIYELLNKSIKVLEKRLEQQQQLQQQQGVEFSKLKIIIEQLIEMEYLKRDDNNKNILIYIP